jgi:F-type H+-transporting ATPase subunit epsilon
MNVALMNLKIFLPYEVLADLNGIQRIVAETIEGSIGFLPHRLDCVSVLKPGILTYQTAEGDVYVAVDTGILVKTGLNVSVSVRDAVLGSGLDPLRAEVEKKFLHLDEQEREMRTALAKIERGFVHRFLEIQHER